tara:strand:- start:108 stop:374 length:267 start_codon:yes stop_codon:yes gene_type:complete
MKTVKIYTDRGHGWAAVKTKELRALGIAGQISHYSYQRGQTAYLEEDCDLSVYLAAIKAAGHEPQFVEKHTDQRSPIRSYNTYSEAAQ